MFGFFVNGRTGPNGVGVSYRSLSYRRLGKRLFDLAVCLTFLPVIVPLVAVCWFLVRLDGGPGIFSQMRVGRGGRLFKCYKLRSMVPDADAALEHILATDPERRAEWEKDQKFRDDPRITKIGRFLRRTSLDEFPQFWNVIRGDMSLVGARPVLPEELDRYGRNAGWYKAQRPGLSGIWQISGRNQTSYAERVAMDVEYARNVSFVLDVTIILKTLVEVLRRSGW